MLWRELVSLYDTQAIKKYGTVGSPVFVEWGNKLFEKNVTEKQIKAALDMCESEDTDYAPSRKRFMSYCLGKTRGLSHNTDAYKPFDKSKALTHKPDENKVKSEMNRIKDLLR
jgi:hypothetical protein